MSLENERARIDEIDQQLLALFLQRMEAIERVSDIKKAQGLSVFHPEREREQLENVETSVSPEYRYYATSFYHNLLDLSKNLQRERLSTGNIEDSPLRTLMSSTRTALSRPRVVVQGVNGSFAMSAAKTMYPQGTISFADTWEDVLCAVEDGSCDYGVLPVENSLAGAVNEVYDLLLKYRYYIVKAVQLKVDQCLLGVRGAKISEIRKVYSHPHAFPQCVDFLHGHPRMQRVNSINTATAAEFVAHEGRMEYGAIASRDCAHIYGLDILAEAIQQSKNNRTRFVSVSKTPENAEDANKISLSFTLPHVTGSLCRTLTRFSLSGLNLTKIESRPDPLHNFEYQFYLDFTGNARSPSTLNLLLALSEESPNFSYLGNYREE